MSAKAPGILAGADEVDRVLTALGFEIVQGKPNGSVLKKGDIVMTFEGQASGILLLERTVLDVLSHCSGVASATRRLVDEAKKHNPKVRVAATRKTIPGMRFLDKEAVRVGGGDTHRLSLSHTPLIKDNHLKIAKSIEEAIARVRARSSFVNKVEVEVSNPREALRAAKAGADIVMFDNFSPEEVRKALELLRKEGLREGLQIEVSGNISEENIGRYAVLDIDAISSGKITHSPGIVDMSLEVVKSWKASA
jgi:nicotinate-nucleotide pyrophosphorylase (carboxylating)